MSNPNFLANSPHKIVPILKAANDNDPPPYAGPGCAICAISPGRIYPSWFSAFVDCGKLNALGNPPLYKVMPVKRISGAEDH